MHMEENNSFRKGITHGLPICLGYLSVAFAFGIFAGGCGLNLFEALAISMTNVTSAGQLAAVPIIASGGSVAELALSQLVINLRYALMSVSLSQKFGKNISTADRFLIAFVNTDEVFAVAASQKGTVGKKYMYGLILTPYLGWSVGTLLGSVAGSLLPAAVISALGIAIYGMFTAIVVPEMKKSKPVTLCVAAAIFMGCLFKYVPFLAAVPQGFVIIICSVFASALLAYIFPRDEKTENA